MKFETLRDLYLQELKDLYNAESQILKALPRMAKAASSPQLQEVFQQHLEQTKNQVQRLDQIFTNMGLPSKGIKCQGMEGILSEGEELLGQNAEPSIKDAALIASAQKVEHYEMAGYGSVRSYAKILGDEDAVNLLDQTLSEEKDADKRLSKIAEKTITKEATSQHQHR